MLWLERELTNLDYGEVGLTFCVCDSKIVRIEKIHRESFKAVENHVDNLDKKYYNTQ